MRIVALDTETTGLEISEGHRVIEIGCVELENRRLTGREFRRLLNPGRSVDAAAFAVHGIGDEDLADKPVFADVEAEFIEFIAGAEVIVHNAAFDVGFLEHELSMTDSETAKLDSVCEITDTWLMAKAKHPGQRNSIDSLCRRYDIDTSARQKHGALLDAQLLAQVWLAMTGGQINLMLGEESGAAGQQRAHRERETPGAPLVGHPPSAEELAAHRKLLEKIDALAGAGCLWLQLESENRRASGEGDLSHD